MITARLDADVPDGAPAEVSTGIEELDARRVAERVEALLTEVGGHSDPRMAVRVEDLVGLLMRFYGAGIRRMMEIADEAGMLEGELLDRFVKDELVSGLLVIHDLHPLDLETRVQQALDKVRPYLGSHGGEVEILGIVGDVVRLRMGGSCSSCPSSTVTLTYAIEKAILEAAPEIARVEAEDVQPALQTNLIQLGSRVGPDGGASDGHGSAVPLRTAWMTLDASVRPGPSGLEATDLAGLRILLCRSGNDLYAYRDRCPNCRSALENGALSDALLTCPSCGHKFDVRLAGRSVGDGRFHLEPLPLLSEGGAIQIAVPVSAAVLPA